MLKNTGEYIESSSDEIHHSEIVIYNAPVTKKLKIHSPAQLHVFQQTF